MIQRTKLQGLRLGMTWGAGFVLVALVIAMMSSSQSATATTGVPYLHRGTR